MKKKITAIFLCIALAATAIVGASLAYFTDKDNATNKFTVGNVNIQLIEQETVKDEDGKVTGLQVFTQDKALMPGTSSDGNAVSKIITVQNNGKNDAWVWVELKIPTALLDTKWIIKNDGSYGKCGVGDNDNSLHINEYGAFQTEYYSQYKSLNESSSVVRDKILTTDGNITNTEMVEWTLDNCWNGFDIYKVDMKEGESGIREIDPNGYTYLRSCMKSTLPAGKISLPCLCQVYMDWRVTAEQFGTDSNGNPTYKYKLVNSTEASYTGSWNIEVNAYAIQADGITSVENAVDLYAMNTTAGVNNSITDAKMTDNKAKASA